MGVAAQKVNQNLPNSGDINPDELIKRVRDAGAGRVVHSTLTPVFKTLTKSEVAQCSSVTVTFKGLEDG